MRKSFNGNLCGWKSFCKIKWKEVEQRNAKEITNEDAAKVEGEEEKFSNFFYFFASSIALKYLSLNLLNFPLPRNNANLFVR